MKHRFIAGLSCFVAGVVVAAFLLQSSPVRTSVANAASTETYRQLDLFGDVFERVRADYVEELEDAILVETAINGMLSALDPHSSYMNAKIFHDMQIQTRGEFGGLGIEVTMEDGFVKVIAPFDDTPAARAGIMAGDLVTHLDGETIYGMTLSEAVDKMRGPVDTDLDLTIERKGLEDPLQITITRAIITIKSVRYEREGNVGYIRVTTFNEQTSSGLEEAIKALSATIGSQLDGYIIDLRNNPGGLLDQAIAVSDAFLSRGEIVSTRGRHAEETQRYNARAGDIANDKPLIVLINGGSASASEIVAGALQDHRRATVLGTRSFGKGSVQTIIPLGRDGALRLTTARYYTPSGGSIQAKGIVPDIVVEQNIPEDQRDLIPVSGEASLRGHLSGEDDEEYKGSSAFVPANKEDDTQLNYAIDLLRGIRVNAQMVSGG